MTNKAGSAFVAGNAREYTFKKIEDYSMYTATTSGTPSIDDVDSEGVPRVMVLKSLTESMVFFGKERYLLPEVDTDDDSCAEEKFESSV